MSVSVTALQNEGAVIYGALLDKRDFLRGRALTLLPRVCALGVHSAIVGQQEPELSENPPTLH